MKKNLTLLILFISAITLSSSCKKDEAKKDRKLLTSGKWYYDYVDNLHNTGTSNCFNENDYLEFRTDGTITASRLGEGTYTLSEDGKTFTTNLDKNLKEQYTSWKGTIHLIKENYLKITLIAVRETNQDYGYEITLAQNRTHQYCYQH